MPEKVIDANEVSINGVRYAVVGGVRRFVLNQLVPQITTGEGDPTREEKASKWHIHDTKGGFGRYRFNIGRGDTSDKFWDSQCSTEGMEIALPPLATEGLAMGAAVSAILVGFGGNDYFFAGTVIRRFDGTNYQFYCTDHSAWETAPVTGGHTAQAAPATVVSASVYNGRLYIWCTSDYQVYDGTTTWISGSGHGGAILGTYGIEWDGNLVKITAGGVITKSTDPQGNPPTWAAVATLYDATPTGLAVYEDGPGDPAVHIGTVRGPYILDYAAGKVYKLQVRFSDAHADNCRGITAWNGSLVFGKGGNVRQYIGGNSSAQYQDIGPNRDDGLPARLVGRVVALDTTMEHMMLAAIDAGALTSSIMKWRDSAWQPLVEADTANESIRCLAFSTITSTPRLWFGQGNSVWWIPMWDLTSNPIQFPTTLPRRASADHITPWFGIPAIRSLGIDMRCRSKGISANETATMSFGLNDDDTQWATIGTVPRNGNSIVRFSALGQKFYSIRFKLRLARGGTNTNTPRLFAVTFRWVPAPEVLYGYACNVDLSQAYKGKEPSELESAMDDAIAEPMVLFSYRPSDDRYVKIEQAPSSGYTGADQRGRFALTMSEIVPAADTTGFSYFVWDGTSKWDGTHQWR